MPGYLTIERNTGFVLATRAACLPTTSSFMFQQSFIVHQCCSKASDEPVERTQWENSSQQLNQWTTGVLTIVPEHLISSTNMY